MNATSNDPAVPAGDLQCRDLVELVSDYLDGVLDPVVELRIRRHLVGCEACADYVEQIRVTAGMAARLRDHDLPPELRAGLRTAFRERSADFGT